MVAAGGDGTLHEVLNGLGPDAPPLAILPLGTANVLAAEIGLPPSLEGVVAIIAAGHTRAFWPGTVNGRRFALMAGIGFDAEVVAAVSARWKRHFGRYAYVAEVMAVLARGSPRSYRLEADGCGFDATAVVVTRSRFYGGPFLLAPNASLFAPELHLCMARGGRRRDYLRYAASLVRGRLPDQPDVAILVARRIEISGPVGAPIQCDGNLVGRLPAVIAVSDRPVPLVVP